MNEYERRVLVNDLSAALSESRKKDLDEFSETLRRELDLRFGSHEARIGVLEDAHKTAKAWLRGAAYVFTAVGGAAGFLKLIGVIP